MATTVLFCPWWVGSFNSEVLGAALILPTGTAIDNSMLTAVQAAGAASGISITTGGAGGSADPVLEFAYAGTIPPVFNNALWIDTTDEGAPVLNWWNGSMWVPTAGGSGGVVIGGGSLTDNLDGTSTWDPSGGGEVTGDLTIVDEGNDTVLATATGAVGLSSNGNLTVTLTPAGQLVAVPNVNGTVTVTP